MDKADHLARCANWWLIHLRLMNAAKGARDSDSRRRLLDGAFKALDEHFAAIENAVYARPSIDFLSKS